MTRTVYLTKSRYTAGLQCLRRLWLDVHDPALMQSPPDPLEGIGQEITGMAHALFPDGVLVGEKPWEHDAAVARTKSLMADCSVPAIFEAAFDCDGVRIRVDVLERLPRGYWGTREVKSSGGIKEYHYDDVALQLHVLRAAGVRVSSVQIVHVNKDYRRGKGEVSWPEFFCRVDVKADVENRLGGIKVRLREMASCLNRARAPKIEPGEHCQSPFSCEHLERCSERKSADSIYHMPRLTAVQRTGLKRLGIESISAIPDNFDLSQRQSIIRNVTRSGEPHVAADLRKHLRGFGPPAFYLDFETFMPVVPLYQGTRPYQSIPFQWSLHSVSRTGKVTHQDFLAEAHSDPRLAFAQELITALGVTKAPIIVYSAYEQTQLKQLASQFPHLAEPLDSIVQRLADLLPIVRNGIYHPDFHFSYSIKTVAPALCSDVTYDDLEQIADGSAASNAFLMMASGQTDAETTGRLRRALRDYCCRDTFALVRLHQALNALAENIENREA